MGIVVVPPLRVVMRVRLLLFGKHWEWCLEQRLLVIEIITISIISDRCRKEGCCPTEHLEC